MRKIIVQIATSADGFIARKDGGIDWLDRAKGDYGMGAFWKSMDTLLCPAVFVPQGRDVYRNRFPKTYQAREAGDIFVAHSASCGFASAKSIGAREASGIMPRWCAPPGLRFTLGIRLPTACAVGYGYTVGFANWLRLTHARTDKSA